MDKARQRRSHRLLQIERIRSPAVSDSNPDI